MLYEEPGMEVILAAFDDVTTGDLISTSGPDNDHSGDK